MTQETRQGCHLTDEEIAPIAARAARECDEVEHTQGLSEAQIAKRYEDIAQRVLQVLPNREDFARVLQGVRRETRRMAIARRQRPTQAQSRLPQVPPPPHDANRDLELPPSPGATGHSPDPGFQDMRTGELPRPGRMHVWDIDDPMRPRGGEYFSRGVGSLDRGRRPARGAMDHA